MEKCIMPDNPPFWRNAKAVEGRRENYHRHEIFYGNANRKLSIEDGLVVFLKPEQHNMSNQGIHFNKRYDLMVKQAGQKEYEKTHSREEFVRRYGKNYI